MEKPSPCKSRPHSAANTPKVPIRSSTIEKVERQRKQSKLQEHRKEHVAQLGKNNEVNVTNEQHQKADNEISQAGTATLQIDQRQINPETTKQSSPVKSVSNVSDFEEREGCCTYKIRNSFILCCGFLCFGASMAIMGPTILELGCLIGSDVGSMSWVFFSQSCAALFGAICSGFIIDRYSLFCYLLNHS